MRLETMRRTTAISAGPADRARSDAKALVRLETMARLLDGRWRIPGTRISFGGDALLSLLPAVGPGIGTAVSAYLIWEARRLGVPSSLLLRMAGNVALDSLISAVPVAGAVGDVFFRANLRNIALLRRHLEHGDGGRF